MNILAFNEATEVFFNQEAGWLPPDRHANTDGAVLKFTLDDHRTQGVDTLEQESCTKEGMKEGMKDFALITQLVRLFLYLS